MTPLKFARRGAEVVAMGVRGHVGRLGFALLAAAGCQSPGAGPSPVARGAAPDDPPGWAASSPATAAPAPGRGPTHEGPKWTAGGPSVEPARSPHDRAADLTIPPPDDLRPATAAVRSLQTAGAAAQKLRPPVLIREAPDEPVERRAESPGEPVAGAAPPVSPGEFLPPIPALPDAPAPAEPSKAEPPTALPPPAALPPLKEQKEPVAAGPVEAAGRTFTFDELAKLVDGRSCGTCGGGGAVGGCSACGDAPCRPGGGACEPFPAHTAAGRVIGLVYSSVCCPDPCYQPKWEPLADAAFFTDAVRPRTSTRFRWDYGLHHAYPDRGEFFFARGDGNGRGPRANAPLRAVPFVDYSELNLITEIGMGAAGVQIAVPYRSVNATPFGPDGAGFADMTITAKTMLLDSELALFGFQVRTYIPIGQTGKGLGTGHVSLEPGLNFGLRAAPDTYLQAQVVQWIPIGGDRDYQGPHLRWGTSINHVLWRPVRDVQLIGTLESTGISFQDGLFTDPALGPQRLAKRTSAHLGAGLRLFFCDTFDLGAGYQRGITGKYLVRDHFRFEFRYRY